MAGDHLSWLMFFTFAAAIFHRRLVQPCAPVTTATLQPRHAPVRIIRASARRRWRIDRSAGFCLGPPHSRFRSKPLVEQKQTPPRVGHPMLSR